MVRIHTDLIISLCQHCDNIFSYLSILFVYLSDPECKEYIISLNGINLISKFLLHKKEEISLNALTTLFYLFESQDIVPKEIEQKVVQYEASSNIRLKNLGKVFLQTYIPSELVEK